MSEVTAACRWINATGVRCGQWARERWAPEGTTEAIPVCRRHGVVALRRGWRQHDE